MDDGHVWLFGGSAFLLIDLGSYGFKEWLTIIGTLIGIGGSIYGAWRTFRYSKYQVAKRLIEHLDDEEEAIKDARNLIVRHIRYGQPLTNELDHDFYATLRDVVGQLGRGEGHQAERQLHSFAELLASAAKVGEKYVSNTNLQTATVDLLLGKIAKDRGEISAARTAWTNALQHHEKDAEAARYLGELALATGEENEAWEQFAKAVELAPDDKLLLAETSELKANFHRDHANPKLELGALNRCAPAFAEAGLHDRAAAAYVRAGTIAADLGQNVQAPRLLRQAFENYSLAGDRDGMRTAREKLESIGDDVTDLPTAQRPSERPVPWFWIRLALELAVLIAAAYLFFLTLR